jgi:hypothetical protein
MLTEREKRIRFEDPFEDWFIKTFLQEEGNVDHAIETRLDLRDKVKQGWDAARKYDNFAPVM